jgi:hypothetical protein
VRRKRRRFSRKDLRRSSDVFLERARRMGAHRETSEGAPMLCKTWCAVALAMAVFPAYAQDSELSKLREALRQLQQQVQQLEKRLQDAEAKTPQAAQPAASRPQTENALNPGISAILNGVYANLQRDPNTTGSTASCRRWARLRRASAA